MKLTISSTKKKSKSKVRIKQQDATFKRFNSTNKKQRNSQSNPVPWRLYAAIFLLSTHPRQDRVEERRTRRVRSDQKWTGIAQRGNFWRNSKNHKDGGWITKKTIKRREQIFFFFLTIFALFFPTFFPPIPKKKMEANGNGEGGFI